MPLDYRHFQPDRFPAAVPRKFSSAGLQYEGACYPGLPEYLHTSIASLISDPNDPGVQHNQMIQEIDVMLEDLDNKHIQDIVQKNNVNQLYLVSFSECDSPIF